MSQDILICTHPTLGSHIGWQKSLAKTVQYGIDNGMYSIQIMLGGRLSTKPKYIDDSDIATVKKLMKSYPVNIFSHLPYTINLAGSKKLNDLAWNDNLAVNKMVLDSIACIENQLLILSKCKTDDNQTGCVLHVGSWQEDDRESGLDAIIKSLNKIVYPKNSVLLLETMVGRGGVLGVGFTELKYLIDGVDDKTRPHLKICIDSCHVNSAGHYNLSKWKEVRKMMKDFKDVFESDDEKGEKNPFQMLGLIHLNDSKTCHGSNKDLHQRIAQGEIWGEDQTALHYLLFFIYQHNIPCVLETVVEDYPNLQRLAKISIEKSIM